MDKKEIGRVLEEIGEILEIRGENPFKVRAYYNAARIVEGLREDLGGLVRNKKLTDLRGIGKNLASHITELYQTGKLKEYAKIRQSVPEGVLGMLAVPGLGPKKVKAIWENLDVKSLKKLERACLQGKVAALEGFGKKTADKILEGIQQIKKHSGQFLYPVALEAAQNLVRGLKKQKGVESVEIGGSLRRKKETVKDIDLVVGTQVPKKVMAAFTALPQVSRIIQHGETKSSVLLNTGIQADLRCVRIKEYPHALQHFTGSKEHNIVLRALAQKKGLKMNEYGLFEGKKNVACKDEKEIYAKLGLAFVPPELREGRGEVALAAAHQIPKLIEEKDIRGVFHCHSDWSDGVASLEEMAKGARDLGLSYFGIADHSAVVHYAGGLSVARLKQQWKEIERLNKKLKRIHIFKGIEADILADGSVDMEKILGALDYVVVSVHSGFKMGEKEMTRRVIRAVKNKHVTMLGHMTGRLLLSREPFALNVEEVLQACADYQTAVEINSNPLRLDIDWRSLAMAREKGVMIVINPDAHSVEGISHYRFGVGIARKGGLTKEEVLNTRGLEGVEKWLR